MKQFIGSPCSDVNELLSSDVPWYYTESPSERITENIPPYRNFVTEYASSDHPDNWVDPKKFYHNDVSSTIYRLPKNSFNYAWNNNGFRTNDFSTIDMNKPKSIFLGCSFTSGIGLPERDIWATKVYNHLKTKNKNMQYINLGVAGTSIDYITLIASKAISKWKPDHVFLYTPPENRFMYTKTHQNQTSIAWMQAGNLHNNVGVIGDALAKVWFKPLKGIDEYVKFMRDTNIEYINTFCKLSGATFTYVINDEFLKEMRKKDDIFPWRVVARDGSHYGEPYHRNLAKRFINKLEKTNE